MYYNSISKTFQKIMETFQYNSYQLGWLECYYLTTNNFGEYEAKKYLNLLKILNKKGGENILNFIKTNYPNLIEN